MQMHPLHHDTVVLFIMCTAIVWRRLSFLFIESHLHAQLFLCYKQEKSCSTLCPEVSRWPLSSLTAQLTNADTNFSSPAVVLLYLTSSSITLALRFSGRALTQGGRNAKPLTAGSTTALGPGHITNTDVFRGVHQKMVPLLKRCFYLLKSPWKLSVGAVSIIHDWCTKVHTWEVHAGLFDHTQEISIKCVRENDVLFPLRPSFEKLACAKISPDEAKRLCPINSLTLSI